MKLTKQRIKQIIKEELDNMQSEEHGTPVNNEVSAEPESLENLYKVIEALAPMFGGMSATEIIDALSKRKPGSTDDSSEPQ